MSLVDYEKDGPIAFVTINRAEKRNAINAAVSAELHAAFSDFRDDAALRVAVLTGAGGVAFSAGADLAAMDASPQEGLPPAPFGGITRDFDCPKPIIAAINGYCLAGGLEIALACDLRICSEDSQFALTEVTLGIIPGAGGTQRLPRFLPMALAMRMLLTGEWIDAETALRHGLVSDVYSKVDLPAKARELAQRIADNGPFAVRSIKQLATRGREMPIEDALLWERSLSQESIASEDAKEGRRGFFEKRKPVFRDQG